MEIWKNIEGYEGRYQISSHGRVKSLERIANHIGGSRKVCERIMKSTRAGSKGKYRGVHLYKNRQPAQFLIHRLVARAFIPNPNNKSEVNHIDGNPSNNHVSNLEWCSPAENNQHAYKMGLKSPPNKDRLGAHNHSSKAVLQCSLQGDVIREFGGTREAHRITGIHFSSINQCARGIRKTAGGFIWKYKP